MEAIWQWYAWVYWKAIRMARVALGSGYGELSRSTEGVLC
jgi:hypothetical protein